MENEKVFEINVKLECGSFVDEKSGDVRVYYRLYLENHYGDKFYLKLKDESPTLRKMFNRELESLYSAQ